MKRDYNSGQADNAIYFIGTEIEKTPAYGMKTLFVVGLQPIKDIVEHYIESQCEHIYLGANKSFDPSSWNEIMKLPSIWSLLVKSLLDRQYLVTLDFNVKNIEWVLEECFCEYDNFIPQISVEIPYIRQLNYNAILKIDDTDFKKSNPGVWCHNLHSLQNLETFTPWDHYKNDRIIK